MKHFRLAATLVIGTICLGSLTLPAAAGSSVTRFFMNNIAANVDFLAKSSQLAATHSDSFQIRAFASSEADEQTTAANAIELWSGAAKTPYVMIASAEVPVQTGRSVAVVGQPMSSQIASNEGVMPDTRTPLGRENLDRLQSLSGTGFDNLYWQQQYDALKQIETDYVSYAADGDDPVLRSIAERELPKVERRIEALSKL